MRNIVIIILFKLSLARHISLASIIIFISSQHNMSFHTLLGHVFQYLSVSLTLELGSVSLYSKMIDLTAAVVVEQAVFQWLQHLPHFD